MLELVILFMKTSDHIVSNCRLILKAFESGKLGQTVMPEDSNPGFSDHDSEHRMAYFTLPMALNYQRDSYKLWQTALKTFNDPGTRFVFDITKVSRVTEEEVRTALLKYKVALQPNKHINTWRTIAKTVQENWGSFGELFNSTQNNFLALKQTVQIDHKRGFP